MLFFYSFCSILASKLALGCSTIAVESAGIAGKSVSWGLPGRLGVAALHCCLSWLRFGTFVDRLWGHCGPILIPKMSPESAQIHPTVSRSHLIFGSIWTSFSLIFSFFRACFPNIFGSMLALLLAHCSFNEAPQAQHISALRPARSD